MKIMKYSRLMLIILLLSLSLSACTRESPVEDATEDMTIPTEIESDTDTADKMPIVPGTNFNFKYTDYTVNTREINSGPLIYADNLNHKFFVYDESWLELVDCEKYRLSCPDASGIGGELSQRNYIVSDNARLNKDAMAALHRLLTDAKNAVRSDPLVVWETYDNSASLNPIYEKRTACSVRLADFSSTREKRVSVSKEYTDWLKENAGAYGYVRNPRDSCRYVGLPHSLYISEKQMGLGDYIQFLQKHTDYTQALCIEVDEGYRLVYFAECSRAGDTIKVPATEEFTISGTNMGGVVVTVFVRG